MQIAQIVLTPAKPAYAGGTWHLEGMVNEHIAATLISYLDCDNITDSALSFRGKMGEPHDYEQNDRPGVEAVYGVRDEESRSMPMGAVPMCAGRTICFPNKLQHRVSPFELRDASRKGVRTIIVFFVVDPSTRVPSTRTIPLQQEAWWWPTGSRSTLRAALPPDLAQRIERNAGECMSRAEAVHHRAALMEERSHKVERSNREDYEEAFSLCEH